MWNEIREKTTKINEWLQNMFNQVSKEMKDRNFLTD